MKKILLLFTALGSLTLSSCNNDDDIVAVDNDTISEVFELDNVDFAPDANGYYTVLYPLTPTIFNSDVVLVYRLISDGSVDAWEPLPSTVNFGDGSWLRYGFNFTTQDILFTIDSDFNLALEPLYTQNQVLRVVIVPGYFSSTVDVNDYDAVMAALKSKNGGKEITIESIQ